MASLSFIIGIIGNVISTLMFASPIETFVKVVRKKSTENYKGLPYITTLLCTSLWSFYGILKPGGLLVLTVNAAGAALHVVFVLLYLIYAPKNVKVKSMKLVAAVDIGFFGAVIVVTLVALKGDMRITLVGLLAAGLNTLMYAAPLSVMRTVIRTKSVKYMPFLLSLFQFLNSCVWSAYSLLVKDIFIGIPNAIGLVLGSTQLILYTIYKNKGTSDDSDVEKEGSAHLVKAAIQMQDFDEKDDETYTKNRSLSKGNSLPKPSVVREYSHKIMKTLSLSPYEFGKFDEEDIEKGFRERR